ncbi:WxL domain-containing protein [Levilactobacillus hammesii]|uniref:WxL domain-containing protein n=1 Tax=Levilactobacillus hammesii DSM 16381 TaxID=1423753 RepID=A0A0R1UVT6_9LACO|nr:WxL domain-containing protein [Levilactobacillus hammesii]KRL95722.1 hypothetical protein FD28_GL002210 [Levilactobacillus hammesii DSM 16381]
MTKKTALQLIATVALAAGFIGVSGVSANAATTDAGASQSTTATVGLTAGTTDPEGPHSGSIQLIAAPDMVFGPADGTKITGAAQTIKAGSFTTNADSTIKSTTTTLDPNIIKAVEPSDVAVNNPGTDDAWSVTVKADNFTKTTGDKGNLLGAVINFDGAAATANGDVKVNPAVAAKPAVTAGGDAVEILSATNGNGVGTWMNRLSNDTNLSINAGNTQGTYTSNLTWTITNTPATV